MNPSDAHSSLAALRQLKEMLDAGTITPAEFETLKRQIVFGTEPALPLDSLTPPPEATSTVPEVPLASSPPLAPPAVSLTEASPLASPAPEPDWLAAASPSLLATPDKVALPEEEGRNPLNLIFAIGGLLIFLGAMAYLLIGRPATPDEHLTSGTQTAADSVAVVPEVGPQAEQLNLPPAAAPETVRVAPATPPALTPSASQFRTDSVTPRPAKAPAIAPAAGSTVVTDSSSTTQAP